MEVLFVLDSMEGLDNKLSLLEGLGADIKFFVQAQLVAKLINNKSVVNRIVAIYNKNINATIDKYIKSDKYTPQATLLYYASADLNNELINEIKQRIAYQPDTIYLKKKLNWFERAKLWVYNKIIGLIFGNQDAYASTKLQYLSKDVMTSLANTTFKNHIFTFINSTTIEMDNLKAKTYYSKPSFNKNYLYTPIAFCLILICYVLLERFVNLAFWAYFLIISMLVATVFTLIVMVVKQSFDNRYRK